jgi:ubiquinone biosynthesis protein
LYDRSVSTPAPEPLLARAVGGPAGLRALLERLGPTWVKCGQYLALRPDLIPQPYCDELLRLVDAVPPFPWEQAEAMIAEDLGADPEALFAWLDPVPVAAGSLAQTHVARLPDGTEVAVKVQRPQIARRVERDLAHADRLARGLELARVPLAVEPDELVGELRAWMRQELDMGHELRNLTRLHELARDDMLMRIPAPFRRLSAGRVLTAEYIRGVPFSELLRSLRSGRWDAAYVRRRFDVDLDRLAENLLFTALKQIFGYRFFHADLHPGNLIALPGEAIGFVDFGLCDELDEAVRERQARFLAALYERDIERMYGALAEILVGGDDLALAEFRRDFAIETRARLAAIPEDGAPSPAEGERAGRTPVGEWMVAVLRIARAHGLGLPARVLSLYRALLAAETVAGQLGAAADLRSVGRAFFDRRQLAEMLGRLGRADLEALAVSVGALLRDGPSQLHRILSEIESGRLALPAQAGSTAQSMGARRRRERLLAGAVLTVGLATLLARVRLPAIAGIALALPVALALGAVYAMLVMDWWRPR